MLHFHTSNMFQLLHQCHYYHSHFYSVCFSGKEMAQFFTISSGFSHLGVPGKVCKATFLPAAPCGMKGYCALDCPSFIKSHPPMKARKIFQHPS
ncbi:hypothetical protein XELAEV_18042139mg [Xenopus laevis]|uniref:Uncharacterized protein n=1 Tax=Xenopus laevis TaxID=8355 RepID=A0A974C3M0_XENLA|nr:hypothetical protein XELAEV_18042139mg [Xenopus laevis]